MTMDEKMVICPKIGACQHPIPRFCGHDKPHVTKINCANTAGNCPACIPVPSTPAKPKIITKREQFFNKVGCPIWEECKDEGKTMITWCDFCSKRPIAAPSSVPLPPDELLTELREEIAKELREAYCEMHCRNDKSNKNCQFRFDCEDIYKPADAILLKCHQSESAEIASLQADIEELNILFRGNSEVYEARIKELQKYKQPEYEKAILQQAKSESRSQAFREVGYEMMRHVRAESGLPPRWVADLIAKLQKGDLSVGSGYAEREESSAL